MHEHLSAAADQARYLTHTTTLIRSALSYPHHFAVQYFYDDIAIDIYILSKLVVSSKQHLENYLEITDFQILAICAFTSLS